MAIVRYGSCGGLRPDAVPGCVALNTPGSVCVRRDPDAFAAGSTAPAYTVSQAVAPDAALAAHVGVSLRGALGERLVEGLNASADGFYASQARAPTVPWLRHAA